MISRLVQWIRHKLALQKALQYMRTYILGAPMTIPIQKTLFFLAERKIKIVINTIDDRAVTDFLMRAEYEFYYPAYYADRPLVRLKKIREHYTASRLLELSSKDIYVDVASQASPSPQIYERLFGCQVLRQDLEYPVGRNGRVIGGSAGCMPLPDQSVTKMALHCSLEHFEGEEDIAFIREAERVLSPDGLLAIVPLYLSDEYFVSTQPELWADLPRLQWPTFPSQSHLYIPVKGGDRHERYYNAHHLIERLLDNTSMEFTLHSFGQDDICQPGQLRFAGVFRKI